MTRREAANLFGWTGKGAISWDDLMPVAYKIEELLRRVAELERKVADAQAKSRRSRRS